MYVYVHTQRQSKRVCVLRHFSSVWLFVTLWTVTQQSPLFRQHYWSGLPFLPPGDLSDPGMEPTPPVSLALQVDSLPTEPPGKPTGKERVKQRERER